MKTNIVNVGYSTGYGRGTARNRPQTGTLFTIRASSICESCRFPAMSQNTSTANQLAFSHEYSWAHIDPYGVDHIPERKEKKMLTPLIDHDNFLPRQATAGRSFCHIKTVKFKHRSDRHFNTQ